VTSRPRSGSGAQATLPLLGLADAEAGRFAIEEEMEELFARYRLP
jgi:predicted transcriptional regulator